MKLNQKLVLVQKTSFCRVFTGNNDGIGNIIIKRKKISAVVGFSGGFLNVKNKVSKINLDTPILLVHGDEDNVVPMEMTKMAQKKLNTLGYFANTYFSKGLGHGISLDGLAESTKFLKKSIV